MKPVIPLIILFSGLLSSALAVAECNNHRNVDIVITRPDSLYTDHGDGTVTDNATGLMWQKCSQGLSASDCLTGGAQTYIWQAALTAAKTANTNNDSGYSDWRLPNKNELESLVEDACSAPDTAINTSMFPNTLADWYWSSSPSTSYTEAAWIVDFGRGDVRTDGKDQGDYVRLVRGSQ